MVPSSEIRPGVIVITKAYVDGMTKLNNGEVWRVTSAVVNEWFKAQPHGWTPKRTLPADGVLIPVVAVREILP